MKITDLPPISQLRHSKGFGCQPHDFGEFSRFLEPRERGSARERAPNTPTNHLESIPGVLRGPRRLQIQKSEKTRNFRYFGSPAEAGGGAPPSGGSAGSGRASQAEARYHQIEVLRTFPTGDFV